MAARGARAPPSPRSGGGGGGGGAAAVCVLLLAAVAAQDIDVQDDNITLGTRGAWGLCVVTGRGILMSTGLGALISIYSVR